VLQGTFDTLSLTEVLGLLAQSHKTGALWLKAGSVEGRVYLADGRCCAAETEELAERVATERDLSARLVDVCFALARQSDGSFRFVVDQEPPWSVGAGVEVDDAVSKLDHLLAEWREIQAVIPSLDARPLLAAELGTDSIIVDQARWRLLVCLDGRRSVRDVMHHTQRTVLDVCNALKELVEEGAVEIGPETPPPAPEPMPAPVALIEPEPERDLEPEPIVVTNEDGHDDHEREREHESVFAQVAAAESPVATMPDPFAGAEDDNHEAFAGGTEPGADLEGALEEGDPRDRGALLRLFSALRDQ
jgi:Domain of unknown function (DUF4388)